MTDPTNPYGAAATADPVESGTGGESGNEEQGSSSSEQQLLAGKYQTEEELQKGLAELVRQQGGDLESVYKKLESGELSLDQGGQEDTSSEQEEETGQAEEEGSEETESSNNDSEEEEDQTARQREEAKKFLDQFGLDFDAFEQEVSENGELSEEGYNKLLEVFPKNVVDTYIEGQKALAENIVSEIHNEAGGEEAYQEMINWASENLSQEEIDYFNKAIRSGDKVQSKYAVRALSAQYQQATGGQSSEQDSLSLVSGDSSSRSGVSGYQSKQEMVRDMQDPRYSKDPAFRRSVEEKIQRSDPKVL